MARNSNKVYEPFKPVEPGICPICHMASMAMRERDTIYARMDEDGIAGDFILNTEKTFFCTNPVCGFFTDKYIATDKGYRYSPIGNDDYIKELNKTIDMDYERPDKNPLIES